MRFHPLVLIAGALLLIGAQDAVQAPAENGAEQGADTGADTGAETSAETAKPGLPAEAEAVPRPLDDASAASPAASDAGAEASPVPSDASEEPVAAKEEGTVAVPAKGEPPTREFMVGVWTEDLAKCASALEFKADGTLIGPFPRWELNDGVLTMVGNRQKIWLTVIDKNTMQSRRSETDPPRTLKRC